MGLLTKDPGAQPIPSHGTRAVIAMGGEDTGTDRHGVMGTMGSGAWESWECDRASRKHVRSERDGERTPPRALQGSPVLPVSGGTESARCKVKDRKEAQSQHKASVGNWHFEGGSEMRRTVSKNEETLSLSRGAAAFPWFPGHAKLTGGQGPSPLGQLHRRRSLIDAPSQRHRRHSHENTK